jgi:DNA-binding transcriptional regulator YiaG
LSRLSGMDLPRLSENDHLSQSEPFGPRFNRSMAAYRPAKITFNMKKAKRKKSAPRSPTTIDAYIGAQIRKRRLALKMHQPQLAKALGVTKQQLQKYETSENRVSAARLYEICKVLDVRITSMFERQKK